MESLVKEARLEDTVQAMLGMIRRSSDDPVVGGASAWIQKRSGSNPVQYVRGAWRFLSAVPYQYDPPGVELVRSPDQFIENLGGLAGDCDDQVVLLGALLHHVQAPTRGDRLRLATVSTRPDAIPHHVFMAWRNCPLDPIMSTGGQVHPAIRSKFPGWWVGMEKPVTALNFAEV